jgi:integrase
MSDRAALVPSYRRHKQSGLAVVTLRGGLGGRHDVMLGHYGSSASRTEYARVIAEWETSGRRLVRRNSASTGISINELALAFWKHVELHYRRPDGSATNEQAEFRYSLKPLKELYGLTPADQFGPLAIKAVRKRMVEANLSRGVVNQRVGRIKRMFKWGVAEEMVAPSVLHALQAVTGIPRGRGLARDTNPVGPVPDAFIDATLPFLTPPVRAMIQLQRLTGMRPGEVSAMRARDIDMTGAAWLYRPAFHKLSWRAKQRVIPLGPKARSIVREFLRSNVEAFLFSPVRGIEAFRAQRKSLRRTKVYPCEVLRVQSEKGAVLKRTPGDRYTTTVYGGLIARACIKADAAERAKAKKTARNAAQQSAINEQVFVPHWHPNQLRHNHATEVRRRYGLEAAGATLGHTKMSATEVYAERDQGLAERIAAEIG